MEHKYLKDFVIILIVALMIVFGMKDYNLYHKVYKVPTDSMYKKIALSEGLLTEIHNIEESIRDRKQFVFTVTKDPLEQNLIVKTIKDIEKQWREEVENMIRLESTIVPENGRKQAAISYKGKTVIYSIGDKFIKGEITDISEGEITYTYQNTLGVLKLQKLPERPKEIQQTTGKTKKSREYNW